MTDLQEKSLQETYAPHNACFGCGPSNERGLRIRSFPKGEEVVATFSPEAHHLAFPGILNGGIIGTLLDCHCNWTASYSLMKSQDADSPPCTVTASYEIRLKQVTPVDTELQIRAWATEIKGSKAVIEGVIEVDGKVTAECTGVFVAVKPGHPAYHRW